MIVYCLNAPSSPHSLRSIWSQRDRLCKMFFRPAVRNWMMENTTVQVRSDRKRSNESRCLEVSKIRRWTVELPALSSSDSSTARMSSNTRTCYRCALRNFKELAYLYRRDIPCDYLPGRCGSRVENRSGLVHQEVIVVARAHQLIKGGHLSGSMCPWCLCVCSLLP